MEFLESKFDIDKSWTLFLDRDGVINIESVGSYITDWKEFRYHEGAQDAIRIAAGLFGNIIVVSNQRGVGRGIMTLEALREINKNLRDTVADHGGRIDKIYNCTAVNDDDRNRKPNTGMGLQAQEDYPEIDFRKSIMVGNSMSDMEFGKRLSMHTVFITTKYPAVPLPDALIDEQYPSLQEFIHALTLQEQEH
jgi:D-glycero-D-manno-heptose 1,7-bisphosphate phosphatase